jgi:hypothetical protein
MSKKSIIETLIETLSVMINEGFKNTATKEDLQRVEHIQKDMLEELTATHADVRYLRSQTSPKFPDSIGFSGEVWRPSTARLPR